MTQPEADGNALIIVGMHRSGTSALAGSLHKRGIPFRDESHDGTPSNPKGHWEFQEARLLNEALLQALGASWDHIGPLPENWASRIDLTAHYKAIERWVSEQFRNQIFLGIKDPRVSRLLPFWDPILEAYTGKRLYVVAYRSAQAVAESLHAREGMSLEQGVLLWLRYLLEAETATCQQARILTGFDQLMTNWRAVHHRIEEAWETPFPVGEAEAAGSLDAWLDSTLLHHGIQLHSDLPTHLQWLEGCIRPVEEAFAEALLQGSWPDPEVLNRVKTRLREWDPVFRVAGDAAGKRNQTSAKVEKKQPEGLTDGSGDGREINRLRKRVKLAEKENSKLIESVQQLSRYLGGERTSPRSRRVVVHFHLFKNAGTSVDRSLRERFGDDAWFTREFSGDGPKMTAALADWILENQTGSVFSSHTAPIRMPRLPFVEVFPVVFLRPPIERIISVYAFERNQNADTWGAQLAATHDLEGYVAERLNHADDRQCRNFHAHRLAAYLDAPQNPWKRALAALEALPFFGLVPAFEESMALLTSCLAAFGLDGPALALRRDNVSRVDPELANMRQSFEKSPTYARLIEANREDIRLYEEAENLFATRVSRRSASSRDHV